MKRLGAFTVCLALATAAHANGVADGNAGIAALNGGQYDEAIRLFTRAIKLGHLAPTDKEATYLDRGLAYLHKNQFRSAASDFRQALKLNPNDAEAKGNLEVALAGPSSAAGGPPAAMRQSAEQQLVAAWGALGSLAGHYWLESAKQAEFYAAYQWVTPGLSLSYSGMDSGGNAIAGQYQLDPATGQISGIAVYKGQSTQISVQVFSDGYIETSEKNGAQVRATAQQVNASSFSVTMQTYKNAAWQTSRTATYVVASPEIVQALGWTANSAKPQTPNFLSGLFDSMKQGALAGLQDGVHDGIQARTRGVVAPKAYPNGAPSETINTPTQ